MKKGVFQLPCYQLFLTLSFFLLIFGKAGLSQQVYELEVKVKGDSTIKKDYYPDRKTFRDSLAIRYELKDLLKRYWDQGFLGASVDSLFLHDSNTYKAFFKSGQKYQWLKLNPGNVNEKWLRKKGYSALPFQDQTLKNKAVSQLMQDVLEYAENHGFPFARVQLNDLILKGEKVEASLLIDKGPRITYGRLILAGNVEVSDQYLRRYLDIDSGKRYREKTIEKLKTRLDQLNFLNAAKQPEVQFQRDKAHLKLFVEKSPASRVNGILGVAPEGGPSNGLLLTGELALQLENPFGRAMSMNLNWQKIRQNSQELNFDYHYPFFLNLPIGAEASIDLRKFDTLFLNVGWELGVRYLISGNNYARIFYQNEQSNLINPGSFNGTLNTDQYANYDASFYGLGGQFEDLDYRLNPTKGWRLSLDASVGQKTLNNNPRLEDPLGDSLQEESVIYKVDMTSQYFLRFGDQSTLMAMVQGKHLVDDEILRNQLFQFGGFQDIRGFNEGAFLASSYVIGTLEFRFLTGKNDHISLFIDKAFYRQNLVTDKREDDPLGLGLGYIFETPAGLFSLNYAIGQQRNQSFRFRNGQINFGFTNLF